MKTPLKFNFGGGKKAVGTSSSLPNSANSSIMTKSQTYLVKRRVDENDSKYSNIVKEVQTFG